MYSIFNNKVSHGALLLCVLLLAGCGGAKVTIEDPVDGSLLEHGTTNIDIAYSGAESTEIAVQLNGVDITNLMQATPTGVSGAIDDPLPGFNVLKVDYGTVSKISRFNTFVEEVPNFYTPLYDEASYLAVLAQRYDVSAGKRALEIAKERGYSNNITVPTEIAIDESNYILFARLHESDTPDSDEVYAMNIYAEIPGYGFFKDSFLAIYTGDCSLELVTDLGSEVRNLCSTVGAKASAGPCGGAVDDIKEGSTERIRSCGKNGKCETKDFGDYIKELVKIGVCSSQALNPAGSKGEPHIRTFDGVLYDNQLDGEFVLSRETVTGGLELQTRQESYSPGSCPTVNTALAMRLDGDTVEYQGGAKYQAEGAKVLINGALTPLISGDSLTLDGGTVINRDGSIFNAITTNGSQINVILGSLLNINVRLDGSYSTTLEGLLGNYDGDKNNDLILRNGNTIWDVDIFNENWRISQDESLFTYDTGESTETFTKYKDCELIPTNEDREVGKSIYLEVCGATLTASSPLLDAMAIDIAAGLPEQEVATWISDFCPVDGFPVPVTSVSDLYADFTGSWLTDSLGALDIVQNGDAIVATFQGFQYRVEGTVSGGSFTGVMWVNDPENDRIIRYIDWELEEGGLSFTGTYEIRTIPSGSGSFSGEKI